LPWIKRNLVPDAYSAAGALTNGARIATADRGFARFPGVSWFDPA
jgi:predicted nucleic acid-binding protein